MSTILSLPSSVAEREAPTTWSAMTESDHRGLFRKQVVRLCQREYPAAAGMDAEDFFALTQKLWAAIQARQLGNGHAPEGRIPFVMVVSSRLISLAEQMAWAHFYGARGAAMLDFDLLEGDRASDCLQAIFQVDDGRMTSGWQESACQRYFAAHRRRGLTVPEGIALVTHFPEILRDSGLILADAYCGREGVVTLALEDGIPTLDCHYLCQGERWCWPSCAL